MAKPALLAGASAAALALWPLASAAVPIWATWTVDGATTASASLPDGRSATFTGFPFSGGTGGGGTTDPAVPGIPSGDRQPVLTIFPNDVAGSLVTPGDPYFSLDLGNWGIDAETSFGLEDIVDFATYRLELLDAAQNPLPLTGLQVSQFNIFFSTVASVSDYDVAFDPATGSLTAVEIHDSGSSLASRHSGLAIFSNLPASTRYIRLFIAGAEPFGRDGLRISLSASPVPEPASALLLAAAFTAAVRARGAPRRVVHKSLP
jgi:hypothetical protein